MSKRRSDEILYQLPETSCVAKSKAKKLNELLARAHELKAAADQLAEVKNQIKELIQANNLMSDDGKVGARNGNLCAIMTFNKGRKTFNRELAVEAGITPEQIEAAMKEGEGYWVCELAKMGEGESE